MAYKVETSGTRYGFVYFVAETGGNGAVKIGLARNVGKRLQAIQTCNSSPVVLIGTLGPIRYDRAKELEAQLHHKFRNIRMIGEWFTGDLVAHVAALKGYEHVRFVCSSGRNRLAEIWLPAQEPTDTGIIHLEDEWIESTQRRLHPVA